MTPIEQARELQDLVRMHADASEAQRHLHVEVAQAFAQSGLYRIAAPKDMFGHEHDPLTQVETIAAIAYADGSAAWNLMIGIEVFGLIAPGFLQCKELIADPMIVMCSSTAAVGRADKVAGGYKINGQWQFVSGCHNAQLFGATVKLWENGEPKKDRPNAYAIVTVPDWQIQDTWYTGGLCGSGSHDVIVKDVWVPDNRIVSPLGGVDHESALLRFPLGARLAYNKVGVAWGMAQAALDVFVELAEGKMPRFSGRGLRQRGRAQRAIAEAQVRYSAGRALVREALQQMWGDVQARAHITSKQRAFFQLACSDSVQGCAQAVQLLCEAAGTTANKKGFPLERIRRDINVVGQHVTVAPHNIEDAGRIMLGLPAEEMMLAGPSRK